jgi:hypothetical protein
MVIDDVAIWLLVGLIAGGMAGAIELEMSRISRLAVLSAGAFGALLGGWIAGSLSGMSVVAFLGAAFFGVVAAVLSSALLERYPPTRYHA